MPLNPSIRFRMETDGSGGFFSSKSVCGTTSCRSFITDDLKMFYYRGLHEWKSERGYLLDTCLTAQDQFKSVMEYFRIPY